MCGIFGFYDKSLLSESTVFQRSFDAIHHRGPDAQGLWADNRGLFLGHLRLSIIDTSPAGSQPMVSSCGQYVVVFNGEIYNFKEIKKRLSGKISDFQWRGHSDTEVLLNALICLGVNQTLPLLDGMFSFAFFDIKNKRLSLARDRFGEKPLYIYNKHGCLAFASELSVIEEYTKDLSIDPVSVDSLLTYSYIGGSLSIYNEVRKLEAGVRMDVDFSDSCLAISFSKYWSIEESINRGGNHENNRLSISECIDETERLLKNSIRERMVSDVPLGAFLSGGIDSSLVVSLMQEMSHSPVKTFSIGFKDKNYNEAIYAKEIAKCLGTEHHEMYLEPNNMLDLVPLLSKIYSEPFADSSQLPTLMVCRMAREKVTVALTGDAGDEVFCGYNRYMWAPSIYKKLNGFSLGQRKIMKSLLTSPPPAFYDNVFNLLGAVTLGNRHFKRAGDKIFKLGEVLDFSDEKDIYERLTRLNQTSLSQSMYSPDTARFFALKGLDYIEKMMACDVSNYMEGDILTKVDRASMSVGLETRLPFLDKELYEFSWRIPSHFKVKNGQSKYLLREILYKRVPKKLIDREKMGFGVPIDSWLRGELREWAEELLCKRNLETTGLLNVERIRSIWSSHLSGKINAQYALWNVLMFQSWVCERRR